MTIDKIQFDPLDSAVTVRTPGGASVRVYAVADERAFAECVAERFRLVLRDKPGASICFATGDTPRPAYARLCEGQRAGDLDLGGIRAFILDEYFPIAPDHPQSFRAFMRRELFDAVGLGEDRCSSLDGSTSDPEAECARYEQAIEQAGGFDLCLVGVGSNGHIAFNEPGTNAGAHTRRVTLSEQTRRANARHFASPEDVPREALTVGVATILAASREIAVLARGERKAEALARALIEPETDALPLSHLQSYQGNLVVIADEAAAALLPIV